MNRFGEGADGEISETPETLVWDAEAPNDSAKGDNKGVRGVREEVEIVGDKEVRAEFALVIVTVDS
jgi:hypothetical protein